MSLDNKDLPLEEGREGSLDFSSSFSIMAYSVPSYPFYYPLSLATPFCLGSPKNPFIFLPFVLETDVSLHYPRLA